MNKIAAGTTVSITVEGPGTWKVIRKKDSRTLITGIWKLSKDGKTLSDALTANQPDGSTSEKVRSDHGKFLRRLNGDHRPTSLMWNSFKSVTVTDLPKACATRMNRFAVDRRRRLIIHCGSGETSRTPNPGRLLNLSNPLAHTNIPPRYTHPQMPRCAICCYLSCE